MEFAKRHLKWSPDADRALLEKEVLECLTESKDLLDLNVKKSTIYGEIEPEHLVEDLLADFIAKQFPDYLVILESSRGTFASGKGIENPVKTSRSMKSLLP